MKNIFLLLSSILAITFYNNISYAGSFKENHTQFCKIYVGSTITLGGVKTKITNIRPRKFPNKSLHSNPLFGIIKWNNSKTIDNKNRYVTKNLILFVFW